MSFFELNDSSSSLLDSAMSIASLLLVVVASIIQSEEIRMIRRDFEIPNDQYGIGLPRERDRISNLLTGELALCIEYFRSGLHLSLFSFFCSSLKEFKITPLRQSPMNGRP